MYIRKIEKRLILLICLITSSIISFFIKEACNTNVQASSLFIGDGQTKVVMVSADYLSIKDISEDDYLKILFNKSYSALASSRQNGKTTASKVKLSIGTGKRLALNMNAVNAIKLLPEKKDLTELKSDGKTGNIIYENIKDLKEANKNSEYINYIGYLGDRLHEMGKSTCILGNSDTDAYNRSNILIAMDSKGIVDSGDVETAILKDDSFPGGKRTDFKKLMELYEASLPSSDFLIIDTGDMARLEYYRSKLSEEEYQQYKKLTINRISNFVSRIVERDNYNTTFLLMSAYPDSDNLKNGDKLTPFLSYTGKEAGFLYSQSTRRDGIITSLDIADYIIAKLNSREKGKLEEVKEKEPLNKMLLLRQRLLNVSLMRLSILTWYAILEIICAVIGLIYVLGMRQMKRNTFMGLIKTIMLANVTAPAALLYMAALDITKPYVFFTIFILASYGIAYIINHIFKDTINRFASAALIVNLSLLIDLIRNSFFIKNSIFGYDPIIGARFYGIGNEFAGVYLGSAILIAGCFLQKLKDYTSRKPVVTKVILLIYFTIQIYIIGMPTKGANFGATIATVCGFYFFFNAAFGRRIRLKQLILLAFIVIAVLGTVISIDLWNPSNTTHIGRFAADIKENGIRVLLSTFERKLEMNMRLIRYTIWTKVLLCIILIITIMFFKPVSLLHGIFRKCQYLAAAWLGISAGSIAGLIVNDSGIVMAATAMIFTGYTILYICLETVESR